jgi:hypothetical protein
MLLSWHGFFLGSDDIDVWIFRRAAEALDLQPRGARCAQSVNADAVLSRLDQRGDAGTQPGELVFLQIALKDRVLNPVPEVLEGVGQPRAAPVVGNIVGGGNLFAEMETPPTRRPKTW